MQNKNKRVGYWAGKKRGPHSVEWRQKQSLALLGKKKSDVHRANIAKARTGVPRPAHVAAILRAAGGAYVISPEGRKRIGDAHRGRKNPWFGRHPPALDVKGKWVEYGGIKMRSSYEARLARLLDAGGIDWKYEPQRFDLGDCTYLPDFYFPATGEYVEVKGWMRPEDQKRISRFREVHPNTLFSVVFGSDLKNMEGV